MPEHGHRVMWIGAIIVTSLVLTNQASATAVHEPCATNSDCPAKSTCKPTSCDGFTCLCNDGFVASTGRTECVQAVRISENCVVNSTRCISEYASCESGTCQCLQGFKPTKDGRCKMPGTNFVGETCGSCEFPAQCINGICKCAGEFRSLTTEEFWVDPISTLQCRPRDYSLDICNGTFIDPSSSSTTNDLNPSKDSSLPAVNTNDWSLILPEKSIYESCNAHSQCPSNSRCSPNSCDGFLCLCDVGYVTSEDRLHCVPAVKTGEVCDPRTDTCLSQFATCVTGICNCMQYFSPTIDGRCRVANNRYVGENCRGSDECEYPASCVNGKCACVSPQRKLSNDEFWIDPSLAIQCRPNGYSVWKCNGTVLAVPPQFHGDIPIDIEIELTYKKEKHGTQEHDDHVEVNPTIVVEKPESDDEFFIPLHIAGILAAAMFALLVACIFKTRRRKAIKRDISLTRTNILANKNLTAEEEMLATNKHIIVDNPLHVPSNSVHIPRPNVSIYNKNGWHGTDQFGDVMSVHDSNTDIYPESHSTTRSTGPFIIDARKSVRNLHSVSPYAMDTSPYAMDTLRNNQKTLAVGPYVVDGHSRNGSYIVDGQKGMVGDHLRGGHYANESWHTECQSDNDIDLVMF